MSLLENVPLQDRPRERLLQTGSDALSLQELLAILLSTGTKGKSVLLLAQEMLEHFGGLQGLLEASISELTTLKGIGRAKAIQLKACFEIALRSSKLHSPFKQTIQNAEDAYHLVKDALSSQKQEMMMVILKDVKKKFLHLEKISIGTLSEVLVHPREVFYPAVRHKAHSFILAHNHPSGDPTPSKADLELTKLLLKSSSVMGIPIDDHIIVGSSSYISLREHGFI